MKEKVQVFGRFLSGMIMPNIGAIIAWGIITTLFIDTGWTPNAKLSTMVGPMITYMLPILIAYTGGKMVGDLRGGILAAVGVMGIVAATSVPMLLGAMIIGPIAGWIMKKFDKLIEGKIPAGFEMLVNNFSLGIIGALLAGLAYFGFAPVVTGLTDAMAKGVQFFVDHEILPLTSIFIEPAKVLFLNNAINHGILTPMGIDQVADAGKSLFFLMEANPGPGLGILLAYCFFGKGMAKSSAPGAVVIHFLGGIHEIYFPYILMNPSLLLAAIAGGMSGIFTLNLFDVGLKAPASPGSIIAVLGMTQKGDYLGVIAAVLIAAIVSFLVSIPLIKIFGKEKNNLEAAKALKDDMKAASKGVKTQQPVKSSAIDRNQNVVKKIVFACDAGMGSSAMGATVLRKKLKAAGLDSITVEHASVSSIPQDAQIVVTHESLKERAAHSCPSAQLVLITNFMTAPQYDELVKVLIETQG
jgi:PTS system mannitol-specific IIC component